MLKTLKIGQRLGLAFGLMLLLLCGIAGFGAMQTARLHDNAVDLSDNWLASVKLLGDVRGLADDTRRISLRHLLEPTMPGKAQQLARHDRIVLEQMPAALDAYGKTVTTADETRLYESIRSAWAAYLEDDRKLIAASSLGESNFAEARQLVDPSAASFAVLSKSIADDVSLNAKGATQAATEAGTTYRHALWLDGLAVTLALAVGSLLATAITRSITGPIRQAVQLASTVAEGDLTSHVEVHGADECAQLLEALSRMNGSLARIVGQVRSSSDSIATGSAQIATGNADLSQRTEAQASNLQQTAASMEELSSTVKTNSDTAGEADRLAANASKAAAHGGQVVGQVIMTMQGIADSAKRIAEIIGVIDGIAFQTNILALNAAVEAARAGEQGRGFAVVASEVRSLASRSADAAKQIKTLIGTSVERVEAGTLQVSAAGASMEEIVAQVERVGQLIAEISGATREQSIGIGQVGDAVTQLDQVTQQNAALVEESAAAAESLRHQAAQLAAVVAAFKVSPAAFA